MLDHQRITDSVHAEMILLPLLRDDTDVQSKFVDMNEYEAVDFLILVGALDIEFDCLVQESTAADGAIPSSVTSAAITQITGLGDNVMCIISVKKSTLTKRYVGLSVVPGNGILGVNCAAVALRYGKNGTLPVTQSVAGSNTYGTTQVITVERGDVYKQVGAVDVDGLATIPDVEWKESAGYRIIPADMADEQKARLRELIPGEWIDARFIGIKPGGFIHLHTDPPTDDTKGRSRYHVVMMTNPYCWNYHGGDIQHMAEGGVYAIDEKVEHASVNWGKTPRVHLVIDVKVQK